MSALIQQSEEWLEMRRTRLGASDAPIVMEVSPWSTPYQLWQQKLNLVPAKPKNKAMLHGIKKEDEARTLFIIETGIPVKDEVVFHRHNSWMMASLDGISADRKTIVEIKCAGETDHNTASLGQVPEKYYPQLQHQLEVCDLDMAYYFSYRAPDDTVLLKVYRDEKYIKRMIQLEEEFWECVTSFVAPKMSEKDYQIMDNDIWMQTAEEWRNVSRDLTQLEKREKELRESLLSQCAKKSAIGGGLRVSQVFRKGNIEYSKIPQLEGVDLDKYRKETIETWRFTHA